MKRNPYATTLYVSAGILGVIALMLAGVGAAAADSYSTDLATVAALGAWSNFLLIIAAVSLVGALVISGIRWTMMNL